LLPVAGQTQYEKLKPVRIQAPDALMPFSLVPACAIEHKGDIILAGKIELRPDEDLLEGEELGYNLYRAGIICIDKNFAVKWSLSFKEAGNRREITQVIPCGDSFMYILIAGKQDRYAKESCIIKAVDFNGKELNSKTFGHQDRNTKLLLRPDGKLVMAHTGHKLENGVDSSYIVLTLVDKDLHPVNDTRTYTGVWGNTGTINHMVQSGNGYLVASSTGPHKLFSSSLYYADANLEIKKQVHFFENRNTEANKVYIDENQDIWLGCNAPYESDPSKGLAVIKLDANLDSLCAARFGKSKHDDVVGILGEADRLVIAHEAGNDRDNNVFGHVKTSSGISVIEKNCSLGTTKEFRKNIDEVTVSLLSYNGQYLLISRTEQYCENLEAKFSGSYRGIRLRTLNHELSPVKEFELGNF
jgi:hypothetical protein